MKFNRQQALVLILMSFCVRPTLADNRESAVVDSDVRTTQEARSQETKAAEWGLQIEDWKRYQEIMDGPRGVFSPGLDPISALGIEARSDEERARYAHLQARMETQRVEKELAYQRAYDEAIAQAVAGVNVVNLPRSKPLFSSSEQAVRNTGSGRLALFVSAECPDCKVKVQELQRAGEQFDIYFVGADGDDTQIRKWALAAAVDPGKVRQRQITLNHDEGRWDALREANDIASDASLPATARLAQGRWVRE